MTVNISVLFSGGGRTVLNILDYIERDELDANIVQTIASHSNIAGINLLAERGLDVLIARNENSTPEEGDAIVQMWLDETKPDLILLCGYLRLLIIEPWMENRILNIHPALLPKYGGKGMYGMQVHEEVIRNGEIETGCTVHFVDEEYDHGTTILQRKCQVDQNDTPQIIADRVFKLECEAYPTAIQLIAEQLKV